MFICFCHSIKLNTEKNLIRRSSLSRVEAVKNNLVAFQAFALQWLVPNFDAFGVLDAFDEEMSPAHNDDDDNDDYWLDTNDDPLDYQRFVVMHQHPFRQSSSDSIRRQYALLGDFSSNTTNTMASSSSQASSNHLFADSLRPE